MRSTFEWYCTVDRGRWVAITSSCTVRGGSGARKAVTIMCRRKGESARSLLMA